MEFMLKAGRIFFAIAMVCFGAHYLSYVIRPGSPAPGPPWFPGAIWLSYAAGTALLAAGASLAVNWKGQWAALLLGIGLLLRAGIIHLPRLLANIHDPGPWTSGGEMLSLCGGAFVLAGVLMREPASRTRGVPESTRAVVGQYLFAIPLFIFGAQHLIYGAFIATLVPAWIPWHLFWAYFIGAAFIAAAVAIMVRIGGGLAASLLGVMFLLWVLILHVPRVAASPHSGNEWTSMFMALAMSGSAWAVAGTLARREQY